MECTGLAGGTVNNFDLFRLGVWETTDCRGLAGWSERGAGLRAESGLLGRLLGHFYIGMTDRGFIVDRGVCKSYNARVNDVS